MKQKNDKHSIFGLTNLIFGRIADTMPLFICALLFVSHFLVLIYMYFDIIKTIEPIYYLRAIYIILFDFYIDLTLGSLIYMFLFFVFIYCSSKEFITLSIIGNLIMIFFATFDHNSFITGYFINLYILMLLFSFFLLYEKLKIKNKKQG